MKVVQHYQTLYLLQCIYQQMLLEEAAYQQNIVLQASQAVNTCLALHDGANTGSSEEIEAERLLKFSSTFKFTVAENLPY